MAIELPTNFSKDIQGQNTNLIPLVIIGNWNEETWRDDNIFISTNSFTLDNVFYKPLLLNVPSLKESIDIEKRNYKISSVNIDISNFPHDGKRFSEIVSGSLINTRCDVYWASPAVESIGDYNAFGDAQSDYLRDWHAFKVFNGSIRKYTHDDKKVKLVVEDLSQASLHIDLPRTNVGGGDTIPDKYKNKYVPMVYGNVERSPVVAHHSVSEVVGDPADDLTQLLEFRLKADTEDVSFNTVWEVLGTAGHYNSALYFYENNSYHNVYQTTNEIGEPEGVANFNYGNSDIIMETSSGQNDFAYGFLRLHTKRMFKTIEPVYKGYPYSSDGNLVVATSGLGVGNIGRIYGKIDCRVGNTTGSSFTDNTFGYFKCHLEPMTTPNDMAADSDGKLEPVKTTLIINVTHYNFYNTGNISEMPGTPTDYNKFSDNALVNAGEPKTHWAIFNGDDVALHWYSNDPDGITPSLFGNAMFIPDDYNNFEGMTMEDVGGSFYSLRADDIRWWTALSSYDHINIGIPRHSWEMPNDEAQEGDDRYFGVDTNIHDAFLFQTYKVMGITDKDYYANVTGRVGDNGHLISGVQNIIADIVQEELGASGVPWLGGTYGEEISEHGFGDYDFTVHEKINSKKLLEGLASASPFVPRFDNMGNFKFDIIKEVYRYSEISSGFTPYIEIKADDVISNSFSRTSINDVYTRVELKYKWDYARKEFSKSIAVQIGTESGGGSPSSFVDVDAFYTSIGELTYSNEYYGLKADESESTLVIDDDRGKYIRDDETAQKFVKWMLRFYANQHLKIKVRLPLRYMNTEIGDILRFDKIIDVKPYGISYDKEATFFMEGIVYTYYGDLVNGQQVFPDFMCTSTNKTLEYCEIECIQMHNLSDDPRITQLTAGCMNPNAWNYNPDAEVEPAGICFIPPVDGEGASSRFNSWFVSPRCHFLIHPATDEYYMWNYPDPDDPIFDSGDLDYGDDLVDVDNNSPPPPRYLYTNNDHMEHAGNWFREGYDPAKDTSTNIPEVFHPNGGYSADIYEAVVGAFELSLFGLQWGPPGASGPATSNPNYIGTTLQTQATQTSYQQKYTQYTTWSYTGVPPYYNFHFFYIPFPAYTNEATGNSAINDALHSQWVNDGSDNSNPNGKLNLRLSNMRILHAAYDSGGTISPQFLANVLTFPFKKMTISIEPTAYYYNPGIYQGTVYESDVLPITANTLEFDSFPNLNDHFNFYIDGLKIKHNPPDTSASDTIAEHFHGIWTIYIRVVIENEFTLESDVRFRICFGQTSEGGPSSVSYQAWNYS